MKIKNLNQYPLILFVLFVQANGTKLYSQCPCGITSQVCVSTAQQLKDELLNPSFPPPYTPSASAATTTCWAVRI